MSQIKAVVVKVGEEPQVTMLDNTLEELQGIVGGYLETLYIASDRSVAMLLNEEGKLLDLKPNLDLRRDVIVGNVVIVGVDVEEGEFRSLTEEEVGDVHDYLEVTQIR